MIIRCVLCDSTTNPTIKDHQTNTFICTDCASSVQETLGVDFLMEDMLVDILEEDEEC